MMFFFFKNTNPEQLGTSLADSSSVPTHRDAIPRKLDTSWEIQSHTNPLITGNTEALIILAPDGTLRILSFQAPGSLVYLFLRHFKATLKFVMLGFLSPGVFQHHVVVLPSRQKFESSHKAVTCDTEGQKTQKVIMRNRCVLPKLVHFCG